MKYLIIRLLRIKDKAHSVARGFTIGALMNFVPTFGFGPFLSTVSPKVVRGNAIAGFIGGLSFLWAFPILFLFNIKVGEKLLPIEIAETIEEVVEEAGEVDSEVVAEVVIEAGLVLGQAFFVGMVVNMILFGVVCYFLIYTIIKKYRREVLRFVHKKWKI
ncbi:DUF2062 domain-containing protein [Evansella tamaricis]|uniref:DUF2062 domain-containing protein n=1 Tax=Evansella tamaricis TaxID=2069301 RepID=UPI0031B7FB9E